MKIEMLSAINTHKGGSMNYQQWVGLVFVVVVYIALTTAVSYGAYKLTQYILSGPRITKKDGRTMIECGECYVVVDAYEYWTHMDTVHTTADDTVGDTVMSTVIPLFATPHEAMVEGDYKPRHVTIRNHRVFIP